MKTLKIASIVIVILLLAAGCRGVYATRPVGEKPLPLVAADWEGTWKNEDTTLKLAIQDAEKGVLDLSWMEGEPQKPSLEKSAAVLLQSGDRFFASMKDREHPERELYLWGRIKKDRDRLLIWAPDYERFKNLVEKGLLPGKAEDDAVILGDLKPEHYAIISSDSNGVLYDWENPIVLIRSRE